MNAKQRQANKRLLTIVSKLDELKSFQMENPDIKTPHDIDNQIQNWYTWLSNIEATET